MSVPVQCLMFLFIEFSIPSILFKFIFRYVATQQKMKASHFFLSSKNNFYGVDTTVALVVAIKWNQLSFILDVIYQAC